MYYIYFIYSKSADNVYIGCTVNLEKRLKEHQSGLVKSTKNRRPFVILHKEIYSDLSIARRRENYLKSLYGSRERKRIVRECLEKLKIS